jgi:NTP pyrophosphatase (non-canonical NTP hydrolase)
MTFDEYQQEAIRTRGAQCDTVYLAAKLTIEAAEAAQPVIKAHYHGKPLDVGEVLDELGDTLWYLANLAEAVGLDLSYVAQMNVVKLHARHGDSYNAAHYQEPA